MSWARYDDGLPWNRKIAWLRAHGQAGIAALGLHLLANTWSRHEGMQGFIPTYMPEQLVGKPWRALVVLLADEGCGMFTAVDDGWMINDYEEYGDRDDGVPVEEKKARLSKVRKEAGRAGGLAKAAKASSKRSSKPVAELKQTSTPVPVPDPVPTVEATTGGNRNVPAHATLATVPPPNCSRHPNGDTGEACAGCARVREWDAQQAERERKAALAERQACPNCDDNGMQLDPVTSLPVRRCTHRRTA